ncbi:MAG TPA: lipid-A-disaccharide synthase [Candidatus Acidoferrum sp.]|nr:lipid-A-disaccharide synthase [Candidatus Acidoferrum sp.]
MPPIPLLISAGEASGDMYAARLASALQKRVPNLSLFGMGGPQMRAAGVDVVTDYKEVSVVGITEILSHLPSLIRAMRHLVSEARLRKPAFAVLTDFPGFHLRLARKLRPLGVQNLYYICPQFWAWRPWRVRIIRRRFAQAFCIFPFEESFFAKAGVPTKFIGHPLVGNVSASQSRESFCRQNNLDPSKPLVAILPGSRHSELSQHMPILREACSLIRRQLPAQFVLAAAAHSNLADLQSNWPSDLPVRIVENLTYDALASADAAIVSSGTATVETALLDVPMVVVYRVTPLTALLAKPLVRTDFFSMVNLIAGRRVVPELIQSEFTPARVSSEILNLLQNPSARDQLRSGLAEVRSLLGPPGAVDRAADAIASLLSP